MTRLLHIDCCKIVKNVNRSFRILSIGPPTRKQGVRLIATSGLRLRILSLGAFGRELVVEPRKGWLMIHDLQFWFVERTRMVPFEQVEAVTDGF